MRLWLLRHGQAEAHAGKDAQRCLTDRGRLDVRQSAARLQGRPLAAILCSPYVRARQTAELVGEVLQSPSQVQVASWLTPDSSLSEVLRQLASRTEAELLLVSHQPLIGNLAGVLEHGHRQQPRPMLTASLLAFDGEMPLAGAMRLKSAFHPAH